MPRSSSYVNIKIRALNWGLCRSFARPNHKQPATVVAAVVAVGAAAAAAGPQLRLGCTAPATALCVWQRSSG